MPFFSIILPTYNRAKIIAGTIENILTQEFEDFELLIIDDGSTDDTRKKVMAINDNRIHYHHKENEERAIARNFGIKVAKGDYITFVDSDDVVYHNYLSTSFNFCMENDPSWLHLNYEIKDEKGRVIKKAIQRKGDLARQLVKGNHLSCLGVFVKRKILLAEMFDEDPRLIGSEDYDLWLRIAKKHSLIYSNITVGSIIQHQDRSVMGFSKEKLIERIAYLVNKHENSGIIPKEEYSTFLAHRYMYLALHLVLMGNRKSAIQYLSQAISSSPDIVLSRKMGAIVKALVF
ncbi:MAG: glycosyltransferase family 2 protein [Bacteroidota bacterium]